MGGQEGAAIDQVVFTNKAACRDCYRCLRVCPVKAIRMRNSQASVVAERCIVCGTCIRECPQKAKTYRNDVDRVMGLLAAGGAIVASVAPSFAAVFQDWERKRLPSALRKLGFTFCAETAHGAFDVARETAAYVNRHKAGAHIASACPVVVNYIERYLPDLADRLVPVVSPMIAHARYLRDRVGRDARVVFIGPCIAKKAEAQRPEYAGDVDAVLTFTELEECFARAGIVLSQCEESGFDDEPEGASRFFPVPGGLLRTAGIEDDPLGVTTLTVSGIDALRESLDSVRRVQGLMLVEPLFCQQGCVGGPGIPEDANVFQQRAELVHYAQQNPGRPKKPETTVPDMAAHYGVRDVSVEPEVTEEQIQEALAAAGKSRQEDQLNCGACGYPTCRDKIIANLSGMAEFEMCVPYMRRLAEQRTDRIISTSPNGILILDEHLKVLGMNPAFKQMFTCSDAVCGKPVSYLMDPQPFERLASGEEDMIDEVVRHDSYNLVCHERLYPLREEKQYVGIFLNITKSQEDERELKRLRADAVQQAKELLEHQVRAAQEMVQRLGETTARGEALVNNFLRLVVNEEDNADGAEPGQRKARRTPWDTSTST